MNGSLSHPPPPSLTLWQKRPNPICPIRPNLRHWNLFHIIHVFIIRVHVFSAENPNVILIIIMVHGACMIYGKFLAA